MTDGQPSPQVCASRRALRRTATAPRRSSPRQASPPHAAAREPPSAGEGRGAGAGGWVCGLDEVVVVAVWVRHREKGRTRVEGERADGKVLLGRAGAGPVRIPGRPGLPPCRRRTPTAAPPYPGPETPSRPPASPTHSCWAAEGGRACGAARTRLQPLPPPLQAPCKVLHPAPVVAAARGNCAARGAARELRGAGGTARAGATPEASSAATHTRRRARGTRALVMGERDGRAGPERRGPGWRGRLGRAPPRVVLRVASACSRSRGRPGGARCAPAPRARVGARAVEVSASCPARPGGRDRTDRPAESESESDP
jgi:hypothetical protein